MSDFSNSSKNHLIHPQNTDSQTMSPLPGIHTHEENGQNMSQIEMEGLLGDRSKIKSQSLIVRNKNKGNQITPAIQPNNLDSLSEESSQDGGQSKLFKSIRTGQNDNAYDPYEGLDHLTNLKTHSDLSSNHITPFNLVNYIQVLLNPLSKDQNQEIITVQVFNPSIRLFDQKLSYNTKENDRNELKTNYRSHCPKKHPLLMGVCSEGTKSRCTFCRKVIEVGAKAYSCEEDCSHYVCQPCNLKHYVRHNLIHQTSQHHFYTPYYLQAVQENQRNEESTLKGSSFKGELSPERSPPRHDSSAFPDNSMTAEESKKRRIADLLDRLKLGEGLQTNNTTSSVRFANVVKEEQRYESLNDFKKFVLISIWRHSAGKYECYRQFKVESPAFLKLQRADKIEDKFFHVGANDDLYYFTKEKLESGFSNIYFHRFNLQKAMSASDNEFESSSNMVYRPPMTKTVKFPAGSNTQQLLQYLLIAIEERFETKAELKILTFGKSQQVLVITCNIAFAKDTKQWVETSFGENLHFIDLESSDIIFTVYNAQLMLDVSLKEDGTPNEVMFLRNKSVVSMEWGSPVSETEMVLNFFFIGAEPFQPYLKCYNFLPPPDNRSFSLQQNDLNKSLDYCQSLNSLKTGCLHKNSQRVTINYTTGGIFTFELAPRAPYNQPSKWQGQIGEIKNFNIDELMIQDLQTIKAEGHDERYGVYTLTGQIRKKTMEWQGYNKHEGTQNFMTFDTFEIMMNGSVSATGQDLEGHFSILGSFIDGTNKVEFIKIYKKVQQAQFYHGSVNQDHTKIVGFWGLQKGDSTEQFEISISQKLSVEVDISYQNAESSWIKLTGVFDQKHAEMEGTFICSKDFEKNVGYHKQNISKNKFHLTGHECQDRAVKLYSSTEDMRDARFQWVTENGKKKLKVCGHLCLKPVDDHSLEGYRTVEFDLVDLDSDWLILKTKPKKITCQVPETFQETYDALGHPIKPYYILMPFNIYHLENGEISFQTQMFYHDITMNARKLIFLQGTHYMRTNDATALMEYKRDMLLPQYPPSMSENYICQYPILAYKSNLAMNNQIVICNLVNNNPQKFVNIAPFTFVEFIKVGLNPEMHLNPTEEGVTANTSIFFLVEFENSYYVMNYRCFPWPVDHKLIDPLEVDRFQLEDQLQLLSGKIDLNYFKYKINPNRMTADKIKSASMIKRVQTDGVQVIIVLQLVDEIVCFNLGRSTFMQKMIDPKDKMLKIQVARGPSEQLYYCIESATGLDQVVQLTFVNKNEISSNVIYSSSGSQILSISQEFDRSSTKKIGVYPHFIYVLKSNKKIKRLADVGGVGGVDGNFQDDITISMEGHPGINQVVNLLQNTLWQSIILRLNSIISLQPSPDPNDHLVATVMSTNSELVENIEKLGFDQDRYLQMLIKQRKDFVRKPCSVNSMAAVDFIGQQIFEVTEAKNNYFLVQKRNCTRRIDLMRVDQEDTFRESQLLIANSYIAIKMRFTNQYMLYDQKTFDFHENFRAQNLQQLTHVKDGIQFFASSNYQDQSDQLDMVIKFDEFGISSLPYKDVVSSIDAIKRQYFTDRPIQVDVNNWSLQGNTDDLLGIFAYSYPNSPLVPLPSKANTRFEGEKIWLSCFIINQQFNEKFDLQFKQKAESLALRRSSTIFQQAKMVGGKPQMRKSQSMLLDQEISKSKSPTVFLIECEHWEKLDKRQSRIALITKDYLVIKHNMHIVFAKMSDIVRTNEYSQKSCSSIECHTGPARFKEIYEGKKCKVQFHLINLEVLSPNHTKNDCSILEVTELDMKIAEKGESRRNAIQITFSDLAIMWDLDENKEVTYLQKPGQFASQRDYTPTGFTPHQFLTEKRNMSLCTYYRQNEDRSLVMTPDSFGMQSTLMRTFAFVNLLDILDIKDKESQNLAVTKIDFQTMLQSYNNLTFFQIFNSKGDYIDLLMNEIKDENIVDQTRTNEFGEVSDNILIRQIYWVLNLPVVQSEADQTAFTKVLRPTIMQSTMYDEKNQHMLNSFLSLIMLSREYRLSDLVGNFECFTQVFEIQSKQIQTFLEESQIENDDCLEVHSCQWNENHTLITFGSNYSLLTAEQIKAEIRNQQESKLSTFKRLRKYLQPENDDILSKELKTFQVRVMIVEIEWLADNMEDLYLYLNGVTDDKMFGNEFIKILLEQQNYTWQLSLKVFLPYCFFICMNMLYFSHNVPSVPVNGFFGVEGDKFQVGARLILLLGDFLFGIVEFRQIKKQGANYFIDFWNVIFWVSIILSVVIVILHGCELIDPQDCIILAAIATTFQWGLLYFWMRLFPELAFYVTMIYQTLKDIGNFLIIFVMCICMFGNALYILNKMSPVMEEGATEEPEPYDTLWEDSFREPFADSVFNQYLIGLGEYNYDSYTTHPAYVLIYIYFIVATLFTQMMFLNMLIAIMSETFNRVSEAKERTALMERTHLYADFMWGISLDKDLQGMRYLYVVRPDVETEENQVSAIQEAQKRTSMLLANYNEKQAAEITLLQSKIHILMESQQQMKDEIKSDINSKFDQLLAKMK